MNQGVKKPKRSNKVNNLINDYEQIGIYMPVFDESSQSLREKSASCLWNTLITFLFMMSMTAIFVDAFELPCVLLVVFIFDAIISLFFSFLYINRFTFNFGYIFILFMIILLISSMYMIINSGFSAILNLMIIKVDDVMNLPSLREYTEFYTDRNISITSCLVVISIWVGCIFNIWISRRMSVSNFIGVSVVMVGISIYLDDEINLFYLCILFAAFVLYIYTRSGDGIPAVYKKYKPYKVKKKHLELEKRRLSKSWNSAFALAFALCILFVMLIMASLYSDVFFAKNSSLKKKTDDIVYNVAWHGISALFNNSTGTGGMNNGSFGNVSSISYDGNTDLEVSFVPYSAEPVYLRSYCADYYNNVDNKWEQTAVSEIKSTSTSKIYSFLEFTLGLSGYSLVTDETKDNDYKTASAVMLIKNVDAGSSIDIYPYYVDSSTMAASSIYLSDVKKYSYLTCLYSLEEFSTLDFIDPLGNGEAENILETDEFDFNSEALYDDSGMYESYEISVVPEDTEYDSSSEYPYLQVPSNITDELKQICEEEGFGGTTYEIIEEIQDFLEENYEYTLSPGATPDDKDFVLYFLEEQKKGFCVHFASSAALLLRTMGVQARYCEGYCFDTSAYDEAVLFSDSDTYSEKNFNINSWYDGYSEVDFNEPISIDVTDANAHAWVEVYFENIGWVPVEFTVGSYSQDESGLSVLAGLSSSGSGIQNSANTALNTIQNITNSSFVQGVTNIFSTAFAHFVQGVILILLAILVLRKAIISYRLFYSREDRRIIYQYRCLVKTVLSIVNSSKEYENLYNDVVISHKILYNIFVDSLNFEEAYSENLIKLYLEYNYALDSEFNINSITTEFKRAMKNLQKKMSFFKRILSKLQYFTFHA